MGLFRILPVMLMVARTFTARLAPCVMPPSQAGLPTESTENCLCPSGTSTIVNSLDPDNTGVERLVIYIYRKLDTGEIISFTPNRQIQHQIPDFPEEYGTVDEVNHHKTIIEIFDNSPSKNVRENKPGHTHPGRKPNKNDPKHAVIVVDKRKNYVRGRPQDHLHNVIDQSWLIPLVKPFSGHVPDSYDYRPAKFPHEYIDPYKYRPDDSDSDNHAYVTPEGPYEDTNSQEDAVSEKPLVNDIPADSYDAPINPYSYDDAPNSDEDYLEDPTSIESTDHHIQVQPFRPNKDTHDSNGYIQPSDKKWDSRVNIIRVPRKDSHGRLIGWQIIKTYSGGGAHHNSERPEINNISPVPYHFDTNDINDDRDGKVPFRPDSVRHRGTKINPIPYHKDVNGKHSYHKQVPSFDYWLEHQLNITTINGNKLATEDIIALHTAIRNTLLQNGLIVTKHGTLVDGHGMVSTLDNLKLRPIIVGKSITFDRFIRNIHSDINFTIPPNSPFLEGLLLTMIKPPKILGIVPLSRSSVSHMRQKHDGDVPINGHVFHNTGKRSSLKVLPISHLVSFRKDAARHQRRKAKHNSIKISKKDQSEQSKQGIKEERGKGSRKPTEVSEEVPDFRIIGGMSATVSGTPILNRGRSGREYEYDDQPEHFTSRNYRNPIAEQFSSRYGGVIEEDD